MRASDGYGSSTVTGAISSGGWRTVEITGASRTSIGNLMYDRWVENNAKRVSDLSGGKLGYIHIPSMDEPGLDKFVRALYSDNFDKEAIVLDVRLPKGNGFELCKQWRESGLTTPILFLTACDDISDRVRGLDLGGDDYLVKPFAFEELLARVRALVRRGPGAQSSPELRVADLVIDTARRRVTRGERVLPLTAREYQILEFLARNAGVM